MDQKTKRLIKLARSIEFGLKAQIIVKGKTPRTTKTAINIPQVKNHFRARELIVDKTSALIIALSTDEIVSKSARPRMMSKMVNSIYTYYTFCGLMAPAPYQALLWFGVDFFV